MKKLLWVLLVSASLTLIGQETGKSQEALKYYASQVHPEKVYLHVSRPILSPGETLWFKAYHVSAITHLPAFSNVLYVQLLNDAGKIVDSRILNTDNGTAAGDIQLDRRIPPGSYQLRAYSQWMRNFDESDFFTQSIKIVGEEPSKLDELKEQDFQIDFMPEGGDLIAGISTRVAFKCIGSDGLGKPIMGRIVDSSGNDVVIFESLKFGMGEFLMKADEGEKYFAMIKEPTSKRIELSVKNRGVSIRVRHSESSEDLHVIVQSRGIDLTKGRLIGHMRGQWLFERKAIKPDQMFVKLSKNDLTSGVVHLTFLSNEGVGLAERLVFIKKPFLPVDVNLSKMTVGKREKVELSVDSLFAKGSSLSISVTAYPEIDFGEHARNISNYLLLSSDLKGHIEHPQYYFSSSDDSYQMLDLLMRTQGWRRFAWKDLEEKSFQPNYFLEEGLSISGYVTDHFKKDRLREATVSLITLDPPSFNTMLTDESGRFRFIDINWSDTTSVVLKATGFKGKKNKDDKFVKVTRDSVTSPLFHAEPKLMAPSDSLFVEKSLSLQEIRRAFNLDPTAIVLEELVKTASRIKDKRLNRPGMVYSEPSNRVFADSVGFVPFSLFDMLRRVPGVRVTGSFPNQSAQIRGSANIQGVVEPLYLLDGIPGDAGFLNAINPREVDFIDVLKGPDATIYGSRAGGGVIAVYTKTGIQGRVKESYGMVAFEQPGYSTAREFYSPKYDVEKPEYAIPDYRPVLYWNPYLNKSNGQAEFFTSDQNGTFEIRIEGMDALGNPEFHTSKFEVK